MSIMLIWPLLIAGVHCSLEVRPKVRSLFDAFQSEYCEDLQVAVSLTTCPPPCQQPTPNIPRVYPFFAACAARGAVAMDRRWKGKAKMARGHAADGSECVGAVRGEMACTHGKRMDEMLLTVHQLMSRLTPLRRFVHASQRRLNLEIYWRRRWSQDVITVGNITSPSIHQNTYVQPDHPLSIF